MTAEVLKFSPRVIDMAAWEQRERARLDASRCDECGALPPNHATECGKQSLPKPGAERHECGYVPGSLGCRLEHRRRGLLPDGPGDAA